MSSLNDIASIYQLLRFVNTFFSNFPPSIKFVKVGPHVAASRLPRSESKGMCGEMGFAHFPTHTLTLKP